MWHVDDLKVSHKDEDVVTYFAQELGRRNRNTLKIKRGKVFDYLGMDLDFESCPGTMLTSMILYRQHLHMVYQEGSTNIVHMCRLRRRCMVC